MKSSVVHVTVGILIGLALATSAAVFAAWEGTTWINDGASISAQKIKDNFDYLYSIVGNGIKFPDGTVQTTAVKICLLPWGGILSEGQSVKAYKLAVTDGITSPSEMRTCTNGILSGSYAYSTSYGEFRGAGTLPKCGTGGACSFEDKNDYPQEVGKWHGI